jgi:hypothetical protein
MQFIVKFNPAPPAAGKTFWKLKVTISPSSGGSIEKLVDPSVVQSTAVLQPDGSYDVPVTIDNVPVGNFSGVAVALDTFSQPMGSSYSFSGNVPLNQGVWFPQPVGFTAAP